MRLAVTHIILVVTLFSFLTNAYAQERKDEIKQLTKDVEYLASDPFRGRETGTKHEKAAAEYIAKRFNENQTDESFKTSEGSCNHCQKTRAGYGACWKNGPQEF